jgi:hypothetical protein
MPPTSTNRKYDRDLGLANLSTATRWAAAGALAMVGLFTAAAAHAFPGHNRTTTVPSSGSSVAGPQSSGSGTASSDPSGNLQPPASPPTTSSSPPVVVSGGS